MVNVNAEVQDKTAKAKVTCCMATTNEQAVVRDMEVVAVVTCCMVTTYGGAVVVSRQAEAREGV